MSGRNRVQPHVLYLRDQPPPLLGRAPPPPLPLHVEDPHHLRRLPLHSHPSILALEDRLAAQHREIQSLILDNQRLAATHVALKQELNSSQQNLRLAADAAARAKAERDVEVREVFERSMKVEAEVRAVEGMRAELAQVRADVGKLGVVRDELVERLKGLKGELARVRGEIGQAEAVRAEIEAMQKEIQRGRSAVEHEKKARADNLEQSHAMEKNMISVAREVEKLRAELANAEKRARAAAAAAAAAKPGQEYAETYGNSEMAHGGSTYANAYSLHQARRDVDGGSQYGSGAVFRGLYDIQQTHAHR